MKIRKCIEDKSAGSRQKSDLIILKWKNGKICTKRSEIAAPRPEHHAVQGFVRNDTYNRSLRGTPACQ
jgi:hypothetical protein